MIYDLPTIRSTQAGYANLAKLASVCEILSNDHISINFSKCGFFDANMTAALQVVLYKIIDHRNSVDLIGFPASLSTILRKNEFLCQYGHSKILDSNRTTFPHKQFFLSDAPAEFERYLAQHLPGKGIPHMTEGLGKQFRQSIFEIFQNCVMHSRSNVGVYVCGQFFPKDSHLDLTISDAGVGIPEKVRKYLKLDIPDHDAIEWAMQEGNTTKTGNQPGGFGLRLLQEFIELNRGKVQVVSGAGFYEFSNGVKRYDLMKWEMPGTTINFEINTNDTQSYQLVSELTIENIFD